MSERTALVVKLIAANLCVGLVLGLLRQTLLAVFNPHLDLDILTRFTHYGFQPLVMAAVIVFSLVASGIQLFLLRPLLSRLGRTAPESQLTAEYVAARSSALRIPWVLIVLHVGIWIIGTTLIYALVYNFDAPGGIPYHWSLTVAVASGLITGVMTALLVNNILLPAKRKLQMTNILDGEHDRFVEHKHAIVYFSSFVAFSLFMSYVVSYYAATTVPSGGPTAPLIAVTSVAAVLLAVFGLQFYLVRREDAFALTLLSNRLSDLSQTGGDVSSRIILVNFDRLGHVTASFNRFLQSLEEIVHRLNEAGTTLSETGQALSAGMKQTATTVAQIASGNSEIRAEIEGQTATLQQSAAGVEEITRNLASLEDMIENQSRSVRDSVSEMHTLLDGIRSVSEAGAALAERFQSLVASGDKGRTKLDSVMAELESFESQSESLVGANALIANIAAQTNLLAMNAAIEAAHAGESGRGFAVVADEIRSLAESSAKQSGNIKKQLQDALTTVRTVVESARAAVESFHVVRDSIDQVDHVRTSMQTTTMQQAENSGRVQQLLEQMSNVNAAVKSAADEMRTGSHTLVHEMARVTENDINMRTRLEQMLTDIREITEAVHRVQEQSAQNSDAIQAVIDQAQRFQATG